MKSSEFIACKPDFNTGADHVNNVQEAYNKLPNVAREHVNKMLEQDGINKDKVYLQYIRDEVIWLTHHYQNDLINSKDLDERKFAGRIIATCNDWLVFFK